MIYSHTVKIGKRFYKAGEEVPEGGASSYTAPVRERESTKEAPAAKSGAFTSKQNLSRIFTEEELENLSVKFVAKMGEERGYKMTATRKSDVIHEFLAQQNVASLKREVTTDKNGGE